jgi:hypothetical protein
MANRERLVYTQTEADARARRAIMADRRRREIPTEHKEPVPHSNALTLLTVPGLLDNFKVVPDRFYKREQGTAVFTCPCGWAEPDDPDLRLHRVEPGGLLECPGCLRIYFMGNQLRAAQPGDAPGIEHSHPYEQECQPPCPEYA